MYSNGSGSAASDDRSVRVVDVRSDTVTKPTPAMMKAIAEAPVGDDVYDEDPTMKQLERRMAELCGKEAALFVPSGTMGNLLAIMVHCNSRGSEAICGDMAHTFLYEQAGAAFLGGVQQNPIRNLADGTFSLNELKQKVRGSDFHEPRTRLVVVENTHNMCGGKVLPMAFLADLQTVARQHDLAVHMDGARVFNATAHLNVPLADIVQYVDSVCICLSKGLCCPIGSVLVGSQPFIAAAKRLRKALGGGMRQVGILAAAGLVSLDTIVPALHKDHEKTLRVAQAIDRLNSATFKVDLPNVHTNILMIQLVDTAVTSTEFMKRLGDVTPAEVAAQVTDASGNGICVKSGSRDWAFLRFVFHHQISDEDVELLIKKVCYVIEELSAKKL